MAVKLINVVKEKYLDTDIDSFVFHFHNAKTSSEVSEVEIPDNYPYMVFISREEKSQTINWIEVVNPEAIGIIMDPVMPDIEIEVYGEKYSFAELVKKMLD